MSKHHKEETEAVPVPALSLDPPSVAVETLPGPQAAPEGGPTEKPKRARHRRTKAELAKLKAAEAPPAPGGVTPEDLARCELAIGTTFGVLSKLVARRRGPHWRLEEEETVTLGKMWTTVLAPYLPRIGGAVPLAAALAVTFTIVKPRLEQDSALALETPPTGPVLA